MQCLLFFLLLQDVMSCQLLLSLIAQSMTLLHRGLSIAQLPFKVLRYPVYYSCVLACVLLHTLVLLLRMWSRVGGFARWQQSDLQVWVAMFVFPFLEIAVGIWVNGSDDQSYKRYLQYLRLEFDTRLGMYSPR